jgi:hypothetical protein
MMVMISNHGNKNISLLNGREIFRINRIHLVLGHVRGEERPLFLEKPLEIGVEWVVCLEMRKQRAVDLAVRQIRGNDAKKRKHGAHLVLPRGDLVESEHEEIDVGEDAVVETPFLLTVKRQRFLVERHKIRKRVIRFEKMGCCHVFVHTRRDAGVIVCEREREINVPDMIALEIVEKGGDVPADGFSETIDNQHGHPATNRDKDRVRGMSVPDGGMHLGEAVEQGLGSRLSTRHDVDDIITEDRRSAEHYFFIMYKKKLERFKAMGTL